MPPKKIGEGAQARYNERRPTVAFRCPTPEFKDELKNAAAKEGVSVPDYLLRAVTAYMEGRPAPVRSNPTPEAVNKIDWAAFEDE